MKISNVRIQVTVSDDRVLMCDNNAWESWFTIRMCNLNVRLGRLILQWQNQAKAQARWNHKETTARPERAQGSHNRDSQRYRNKEKSFAAARVSKSKRSCVSAWVPVCKAKRFRRFRSFPSNLRYPCISIWRERERYIYMHVYMYIHIFTNICSHIYVYLYK